MRLSLDYRRVALFNTAEGQDVEYSKGAHRTTTNFQVGPFVYKVEFIPDNESVFVAFTLQDIVEKDPKKLERILYQVVGGDAGGVPGKISPEQVQEWKKWVTTFPGNQETLRLGGQVSTQVFGNVLNTVKDYVRQYQPKCINFGAEENRVSLYSKLMRRAFPQASIEADLNGDYPSVLVCFRR